jgi:predicted permease
VGRFARLVRRLRGVVARAGGRDVNDELQLHLDLLAEEYRAEGLSDADARARAQREFGNPTRLAEQTREVSTVPWIESALKDVAYGLRQLRRQPLVTTLAVVSLAIGIGANTAVFSIVNGLALRTLPVPAPERLAALSLGDQEVSRVDGSRWSYVFWRAFEAHRAQFDGVMAWSPTRVTVGAGDAAEPVDGVFVDGGFFRTVRAAVMRGRPLGSEDDRPGAAPVVVISHGYWQRAFGGAGDVIGHTLSISETLFEVVGVTEPAFTGLEVGQAADLILPLSAEAVVRGAQSFIKPPFDAMNMWLRIGVRLREGQTLEHGAAVVQALQPRLREAALPAGFPQLRDTFLREPMTLVSASTGLSRLRQLYRRPLDVLMAVVGIVLLLASVNVASLLLAQATARAPEIGLRLALGGSRWRVARQLVIEAALLTAGGLVLGLMVAQVAARVLIAQLSSAASPVTLDVGLDGRVLAATMMIGVLTTLVCGTAAAWRVNTVAPAHTLIDASRGAVGGHRARPSSVLLGCQVGLALTLVVAAGLFMGTFARLLSVPLGFDRDAVLLANVSVARADVPPGARLAFYERLVDAVRAVPGVAFASASTLTPVSASFAPIGVRPITDDGMGPMAEARSAFVTPDWFATYGLPLLRGRDISASDSSTSAPVVVVNRALAERFFPGRDAVGESIGLSVGPDGALALPSRTIVGVVENAIYRSLREAPQPTAYLPLAQYDYPVPVSAFIALNIRAASGSPLALARDVSTAMTGVNPQVAVTTRTLAGQVRESVRQEQLLASLSGLFGAIALLLAAIGLFGVTGYAVARRRSELAVRLAVGATWTDVVRTVLGRFVAPVGLGLTAGVALATWLARFVSSLLFGVTPSDPAILALSCGALVASMVAAAWIPVHRALRIDPSEVLRAP